jgi:hypothetical protein
MPCPLCAPQIMLYVCSASRCGPRFQAACSVPLKNSCPVCARMNDRQTGQPLSSTTRYAAVLKPMKSGCVSGLRGCLHLARRAAGRAERLGTRVAARVFICREQCGVCEPLAPREGSRVRSPRHAAQSSAGAVALRSSRAGAWSSGAGSSRRPSCSGGLCITRCSSRPPSASAQRQRYVAQESPGLRLRVVVATIKRALRVRSTERQAQPCESWLVSRVRQATGLG